MVGSIPADAAMKDEELTGLKEILRCELNDYGSPKAKMPDCPVCGEDELGVINEKRIFCYRCCFEVEIT